MDEVEIRLMQAQESTYWWHVGRRLILESILNRFLVTVYYKTPHPTSPYQGEERRGCHPEPVEGSLEPVFRDSSTSSRKDSVQNDNELKILDVGCGTGANFKWLQKFGAVTGVDSSEAAVALANLATSHNSNSSTGLEINSSLESIDSLEFIHYSPSEAPFNGVKSMGDQLNSPPLGGGVRGGVLLGRAEDLPVEDREFDLVTAFDVLEHVVDESRVLGEWGRVLSSGGRIFLAVPAYQGLFGPHDRALEHLRRYNLSQLKDILQNNGFRVEFASYMFCLTFPVFWLQRTLAKKSTQASTQYVPVSRLINELLIGLGKVEAWWLSFAKFPFGSSIVVLAKKE